MKSIQGMREAWDYYIYNPDKAQVILKIYIYNPLFEFIEKFFNLIIFSFRKLILLVIENRKK
jgi:hypothetical protein